MPLHLIDRDEDQNHTLCGLLLDTLADEEWTDATVEVLDSLEDFPHACPKCTDLAAHQQEEDDREWRNEIAREEGMLNGINSYNDWREDFHSDLGTGPSDPYEPDWMD